MPTPETRASLLLRIRDPDDQEAWFEFEQIYRPVIYRLAMLKGLQSADAEDLTQKVLLSVANAIDRWQPDGSAKFRTWLRRVAENAILNALTRGPRDKAAADSQVRSLIENMPDENLHARSDADSKILSIEFRREVFNWAAARIQNEFAESTWQAFWMTAVDGIPISEAVKTLNMKRGSVYAARSRVMKRLKKEVQKFETKSD